MKLSFFGAAREVTGSNYLFETDNSKFLVDCGIFQGELEEHNDYFYYNPSEIDFVILTHAHLDHSGRIPLLVKKGFKGKVYLTPPTAELVHILWMDSVKLMKEDVERINRRRRRSGEEELQPLFTEKEVEIAEKLFVPISYDDIKEIGDVKIRFRDAGHILGSSSVEIWANELKVVFSGDLGQKDNVIEGVHSFIEDSDYVVVESTYGDRLHKSLDQTREEFKNVVLDAIKSKGKILIPSFVVDRAQRIIYELFLLRRQGILPKDLPVFFDSPMGGKITDVYKKYEALLGGEIMQFYRKNENPLSFPNLKFVSTPEESKKLNEIDHAIIIAGSGMCTGGRILHHLKHNIWKDNTHIIFVGYQGKRTLGRAIIDGLKKVHLFGETIHVNAKIHTLNGFSSHADYKDLTEWIQNFKTNPFVFITHGEEQSALSFAKRLESYGKETYVPQLGEGIDLKKRKILPFKVGVKKNLDIKFNNLLNEVIENMENLKDKKDIAEGDLAVLESINIILKEKFKVGEMGG